MVGSQLDLSRHEHTCSPGANIGSTPLPFREGCQLHRHIALLTLAGGEDAISFQGLGSQAQGLSGAADKLVGRKLFQVQVHERPWSPLAGLWRISQPYLPPGQRMDQGGKLILELDLLDPTHAMAHAVS